MTKQPDSHLELALKALERVPRFLAKRTLKAYLDDELCQSAVERQLEVAGDSLAQVRKLAPDLFARIRKAPCLLRFATYWLMATPLWITGVFTMRRQPR